jgi:SAM-dependent methyltransferase
MESKTDAAQGASKDCGCNPVECCGAEATPSVRADESQASASAAELAGDVRVTVREKYGAVARDERGIAGCCAGAVDNDDVLRQLGYTAEQMSAIPQGANLGLGCGSPTAHAALAPGETVLDLGSGAGIDCFIAASEVGPHGRVIGVDMTPDMIDRARGNAAKAGHSNVEFRLGEIEHLPVADASVDVVISNCVVNLSPDKPQVFREALRVLRPGGRLVVSDLVLTRPLDPALQRNVELYVGCVAGAALEADYLRMIADAGFDRVTVLSRGAYTIGADSLPEGSAELDAFRAVVSLKVQAKKRGA